MTVLSPGRSAHKTTLCREVEVSHCAMVSSCAGGRGEKGVLQGDAGVRVTDSVTLAGHCWCVVAEFTR